MLVLLLQKYQRQWKEEVSREQLQPPRSSVPQSSTPLLSSDVLTFRQPRQEDLVACNDPRNFEISALVVADAAESHLAPLSVQPDPDPPNNLEILPHLKSMTWTIENPSSAPANKVAIVDLKLEDCSKSPGAEREVKFRLTKDTTKAALTSLTYITEKFSSTGGTSSDPVQKKQKH